MSKSFPGLRILTQAIALGLGFCAPLSHGHGQLHKTLHALKTKLAEKPGDLDLLLRNGQKGSVQFFMIFGGFNGNDPVHLPTMAGSKQRTAKRGQSNNS